MTSSVLVNIQKAQNCYNDVIIPYLDVVEKEEISFREIAMMLDELKCFWLERINIIDFELEELSRNNSCFLLSGAIYLDVFDYEQYFFKSMGDYHLLFDPFLKMEAFFRAPENDIDIKETISYFKKVYYDAVEILKNYRNDFYILPIREIAIKDEHKHRELIDKFFLNFISSSFKKDFRSQEEFCSQYQSYEKIEEDMDVYIREHLIFNDQKDFKLPLREKIERYCKTQMNFLSLTKGKSESQIFLLSIYTWIAQIVDILLICTCLRLKPYIRFNITFHYLAMIMYNFIEDKDLKEMIENTIIFYIFYKTINKKRFKNVIFSEYCLKIKEKKILPKILEKIHDQRIDIFKGGIKKIEKIITEKYKDII